MAELVAAGFHSSFRNFGGGRFEPDRWERYFLQYSSQEWEDEGDGVLSYRGPADLSYSLIIVHVPKEGFVIQNECHNRRTNRGIWCKFGVESINQLKEFVRVGDEFLYPKGCILRPTTAWAIVKNFLQDPTSDTKPVLMSDDAAIEWPEL